VTADGKLVRASHDENADLFWGLRGGGGNFGVVTGIDFRLYPVGPEIVGGVVAWPASDAPQVYELFREMAESAPRELTLVTILRPAPPAPWLPKEIHLKPIVGILACYSGDPAEGEKLVAPIKSFGNPVGDVLVRRPYAQLQALLDATQPKGRRYYWKSEYLPAIEPELCAKLMQHGSSFPSLHNNLILFQMDGALNELSADHSPVGNRDARYAVNLTASWDKVEDDAANMGWIRQIWEEIKPFSTGGTYLNFLNQDDGMDRTQEALRGNLERLAQVKAKWDPDNFFRTNRNIQPQPA
jgi:FAD/FMN-containing dehydrogenase